MELIRRALIAVDIRLVTISLPKATAAIIVLSQLDTRYFAPISGRSYWTFDFMVFKKGEKDAVAESSHSRIYARSVNLEIDLDAGDYVVHVSTLFPLVHGPN